MTQINTAFSAEQVENRAAEFIIAQTMQTGWSSAQSAELHHWLEESTAHRLAYLRLHQAWSRSARLNALRRPAQPHRPRPHLISKLARAAIFAALLIGAYALVESQTSSERSYATALGGHDILKLPDGTIVELDTNTIIRVNLKDSRKVWLDKGQAYFQVAHDPRNSFTVTADHRTVTVLGTKFLLRKEDQRLNISVMEGRVRLEAHEGRQSQRSALLSAGDAASATKNKITVSRLTPREREQKIAWRKGLLIFDQRKLSEAVAELNRYNSQKLVLADAATENLIIGGTFRTNDSAAFARMLEAILQVKVKTQGNDIILSSNSLGG